ncbi:MAG: endonuclease [Acidobacteria bacterium]|nr:MAG: endonuclease [Acidobacteriota bacterium]
MPEIRICSFNVEWMNDWFTSDSEPAAFKPQFRDRDSSHLNDTDVTAKRTAAVIRAVDPDILAIQEGPSRQSELELFVAKYLANDVGQPLYRVLLGDSGGAQKLGVLYKPASVTGAGLAPHGDIVDLIDPWLSDVDGDAILEEYRFTRTPLVVNLAFGQRQLQLIVAHTKSNFINNGKEMWNNPQQHQNYIVTALKDRRRISAEAMRIRSYIDAVLARTSGANVIVLGDMNDGPGLDYFEKNFLTHNVVDILFGSQFRPEWTFHHAQHDLPENERYTAIFDDFVEGIDNKHMLLDHILLSPGLSAGGLRKVPESGAVHHNEYSAQVVNGGAHREDRPSDHRPVSVRLRY